MWRRARATATRIAKYGLAFCAAAWHAHPYIMKLAIVALAAAADASDATWGAHSTTLPEHDWVVLDYAPGGSFGYAMTCSRTHARRRRPPPRAAPPPERLPS